MKIRIIPIMCILALSGCAPDIVDQPISAEIPIPVLCQLDQVAKPDSPIHRLAGTEEIGQSIPVVLSQLERDRAYEAMLRAQIDRCRATQATVQATELLPSGGEKP